MCLIEYECEMCYKAVSVELTVSKHSDAKFAFENSICVDCYREGIRNI